MPELQNNQTSKSPNLLESTILWTGDRFNDMGAWIQSIPYLGDAVKTSLSVGSALEQTSQNIGKSAEELPKFAQDPGGYIQQKGSEALNFGGDMLSSLPGLMSEFDKATGDMDPYSKGALMIAGAFAFNSMVTPHLPDIMKPVVTMATVAIGLAGLYNFMARKDILEQRSPRAHEHDAHNDRLNAEQLERHAEHNAKHKLNNGQEIDAPKGVFKTASEPQKAPGAPQLDAGPNPSPETLKTINEINKSLADGTHKVDELAERRLANANPAAPGLKLGA